MWGTGPDLYLTLDRGDIWDLRYQPNTRPTFTYSHLQELVRERRHGLIQQQMTSDVGPMADIVPTRLSMGRLKISLPSDTQVERATLDMQHGEVRWLLSVHGKPVHYRVLASINPDVILVTLDGVEGWEPEVSFYPIGALDPAVAGKLGYPKPDSGTSGRFSWSTQSLLSSGAVTTAWTAERKRERVEPADHDTCTGRSHSHRHGPADSKLGAGRGNPQDRHPTPSMVARALVTVTRPHSRSRTRAALDQRDLQAGQQFLWQCSGRPARPLAS